MTRRSPAIANWLLSRLGVTSALAGDLREEFEAGKSRAWYWRQTMSVVGTEMLRRVAPAWPGFALQVAVSAALYYFHVPPQLTWNAKLQLALVLGFGLPALALLISEQRSAARSFFNSAGPFWAGFVLIECDFWQTLGRIEIVCFVCSMVRAMLARPVIRKA